MGLLITFDAAKDASNQAKHGISLRLAQEMDWDRMLIRPDKRFDYGEHRLCGLGAIGRRLHFVVFVDRSNERRVISLRKANFREMKFYAANYQDP